MKTIKPGKAFFIRVFILMIPFLFMGFSTGDSKSEYSIPLAAWSVTAGDIDMDGDNDIVVGHNYSSQTQWSGVSFLLNDGNGTFYLYDSLFLFSWQTNIYSVNLNTNIVPEIIARHYENETQYMAILKYEQGVYVTNLFDMLYGISGHNIGDVNGDGFIDIVIYSSDFNNKFWGLMYNDGTGNFSIPEYHFVTDYFPNALVCGLLNEDNRADIVVCGQSTEVYFSYPEGFQLMELETNSFKEGVSIVDFDLDNDNDLLSFCGTYFGDLSSITIYQNHGTNIFDTLGEFYFPFKADKFLTADFNNDSLPDVLFQLLNNSGYFLYYNKGNFQFGDSLFVPLPPSNPEETWRNCYSEDMDGNGYFDIISIKTLYVYLPDNLVILFNDGNGNFVENPITSSQTSHSEFQTSNLNCYPNPFKSETTFDFVIKETAQAELSVYDLQGRLIANLTNNDQKGGHTNKIKWDGFDVVGKPCKPGPLVAYLKVNGKVRQSIKLIKLN
jgi:hypothetical protein